MVRVSGHEIDEIDETGTVRGDDIASVLEHTATMSDAHLDQAIRASEADARRHAAHQAVLLAIAEDRQIYRTDGHHSMAGYLRATCNTSTDDVARRRKLAALVDAVPEIGSSLLAGRIGVVQALQIDRIRTNPRLRTYLPAVAPVFVEFAEHRSYDEFRGDIDEFIRLVDSDGTLAGMAADVESRTGRVTDLGGVIDIVASGGDPLTAMRLVAVFDAFVEAEFRADVEARRLEFGDLAQQHPMPRTAAQRRFDALVTIFRAAASAPDAPNFPESTLSVVIDERSLDEAFVRPPITLDSGDQIDLSELTVTDDTLIDVLVTDIVADPHRFLLRRCVTATGAAVHPLVALEVALAGHVRRVVIDSRGVVVDLGRKQRLFTGNARLAAQLLNRYCTHPGCRIPAARCDVDHIDGWAADDGPTVQRNATIRCGSHDRFKHRERWKVRRDSRGRVYNIRADGSVVLPVGEDPPDLSIDELERLARARARSLRR
ncbi:MAG: HNH endonuclease signature motif containing protein [Ilumatobacteraceae bacterium]